MASNYPPFIIEALDAEATGTRIVFKWHHDRYFHAIYGVCLGKEVLLAESVEGDAMNLWPSSPPLQQLHKQPRATGGEVLFATGMAGRSHWSGSVTTSIDQRWTEVTFEFACRHRAPPDWLGVTYRLTRDIQTERRDEETLVLKPDNSLEYIVRATAIPVSIATEMLLTSSVSLSGRTLRIAAKQTPHMTTAKTNRWAYSVQLTRPYWVARSTD